MRDQAGILFLAAKIVFFDILQIRPGLPIFYFIHVFLDQGHLFFILLALFKDQAGIFYILWIPIKMITRQALWIF